MGNSLSTTASSNRFAVGTNSNLLAEVGNDVHYDKSMGSSRFLKAIRARHRHGPIVVKTFLKSDPGISLRNLVRRLRAEREALKDVPNVLAYQKVIETERAGYLIRQWLASNLYDRISTRPFLTNVEKKWITYQLLYAMREARKKKVSHGDLKSENILVTSSLTIYITDFSSSFKPTFLPLDDPADFSFFYDTSGRRTCYLSPERFFESDSEIGRRKKLKKKKKMVVQSGLEQGKHKQSSNDDQVEEEDDDEDPYSEILGLNPKREGKGKVTESMDVFSLGCVISELWRDGSPIFTLSQLFKFRKGLYDPEMLLNEIDDIGIREMVKGMISLKPENRGTFQEILEKNVQNGTLPKAFDGFLHGYLMELQKVQVVDDQGNNGFTNPNMNNLNSNYHNTSNNPSVSGYEANSAGSILRSESDERIERLYEEWSIVIQNLSEEAFESNSSSQGYQESILNDGENEVETISGNATESENFIPVQLCIPGLKSQNLSPNTKRILKDGNALIILSVILSNLRNCKRPSSKLHAMELLLHLSNEFLTDETKLDRAIPFMITLLNDDSVLVRSSAIRNLTQILLLVETLTPSNSSIITEYILPNISHLRLDSSPIVRSFYSICLIHISQIGEKFLQISQAIENDGILSIENHQHHSQKNQQSELVDFLTNSPEDFLNTSYDFKLKTLQNQIQDQVTKILTEETNSSVKRSLLENLTPLTQIFGMNETNDVLISHMITNLNDKNWLVRESFFDSIVKISLISSRRTLSEYILPLMLQALSDSEEFVILKVIKGLNVLLTNDLFEFEMILNLLEILIPYTCHPNFWIRESVTEFIGNSIQYLDEITIWSILYPSLRPLLKNEIVEIDQLNLLENLKPPISRSVFQAAIQWANKSFSNNNSRNHSASNGFGFWKPPESSKGKEGLSNSLGKEGIGLNTGKKLKDLNRTIVHRSEEDDAHLDKLRSLGMCQDDEVKLVAMRDYIWKLARQNPSRNSSITAIEESDSNGHSRISSGLEVQTLEGVTPQTIFFSSKPSTSDSRNFNTMIPEGVSFTQSLRSQTDGSFSGRMAKRRLTGLRLTSEGSILSPLEELRRRMASNSNSSVFRSNQTSVGNSGEKESGKTSLEESSSINRATSPSSLSSQQGRLGIKAAPIITSQRATAIGTMTDSSSKSRNKDSGNSALNNLDSALTTPIHSNSPTIKGEEQNQGYNVESAGGPSFSSTYDGNDPYIKAHLEAVYLSSYRDRAPELGPRIGFGSNPNNRRRIAGAHSRSYSTSSRNTSNRKPEGNLIAYFNEHTAAITSIAVSPDHLFFVSGSQDGSIKIWDTIQLEKNVTAKSKGSYNGQRGSIVTLLCLENSHCVASCSSDGSLHIWRIEIVQSNSSSSIPKYNGKPKLISNFQLSTPGEYATCLIQNSNSNSSSSSSSSSTSGTSGSTNSSLILGTTHSRITVLDLRTMQVLLSLQNPIHYGPITCLCTDKKKIWLLVGTMNGILSLWDLRFHLLLKSWRVGANGRGGGGGADDGNSRGNDLQEVDDEQHESLKETETELIKINKLSIHPGRGRGRWVLVAYERLFNQFENAKDHQQGKKAKSRNQTIVETWDIEKGICVESFEVGAFPRSNSGPSSSQKKSNQIDEDRDSENVSPHPQGNGNLNTNQGAVVNKMALEDESSDLGGPAAAIERLIKLHQIQKNREADPPDLKAEGEEEEEDVSISIDENPTTSNLNRSKFSSNPNDLRPIPSSTSNVKAMYVGIEGYSSSSINSDSVTGGWLDAGKLVKESTSSGNGLAGYMITAGEDRKIRFWDLGRIEKSICLGLMDERSEFRAFPSSNLNQSHQRNIHHLHTPSSSKLFQIKSPLLNSKQTQFSNSLMKNHKDSITALAVIESPFRCVVAGDASGCIRVWE